MKKIDKDTNSENLTRIGQKLVVCSDYLKQIIVYPAAKWLLTNVIDGRYIIFSQA